MAQVAGHHTKPEIMRWFNDHNVDFITRLAPNNKLYKLFDLCIREAKLKYQRTGPPARTYASAYYAAGTWGVPQRVICRVLVSDKGTDMRAIVTSFQEAGAKYLLQSAPPPSRVPHPRHASSLSAPPSRIRVIRGSPIPSQCRNRS